MIIPSLCLVSPIPNILSLLFEPLIWPVVDALGKACCNVGDPVDGSSVNNGPTNVDSLDDEDFDKCSPNNCGYGNDSIC